MKKIFLILFTAVLMTSCEEDIKTNNPSVQGRLENVFWRAIDSKAELFPNGSLVITAKARLQTMTLKVPSKNKGVYVLGQNMNRTASFLFDYEDDTSLFYQTGVTTEDDFQGDGQIEITEYDDVNGTVSGNFRFNAYNVLNNPIGGEILNFNQGVFYKVQVRVVPGD
ncbi:DUF6252 family protein [Flavobacterium filum]|uniref:DUF6252 family protein n=1 Tax=Flavobacterium filum TaxID=370974 RepID=UPI0023F0DDDC|nr:DUF6252 family protein [Flavobacterium filum]